MQNVKFICVHVLSIANAKKSNHSELYNVHNGSIYDASRRGNT